MVEQELTSVNFINEFYMSFTHPENSSIKISNKVKYLNVTAKLIVC